MTVRLSPSDAPELDLDALFAPLARASGLVAAVSGGPDSMALLHLLARWREAGSPASVTTPVPPRLLARRREAESRPPVTVATVDHGLRPESAGEAALVERAAGSLGLPHRILPWTGEKPSRGLPEAARGARYRLLVELAREVGASHLVTAHTRDDQAETVLMRLARGSGPAGLAGMRPVVERDGLLHARPLLGVPKAALVDLCRRQAWPFVEDPTNRDDRYARPRWRRLMPALAAEGLTPHRLARLAERMLRAEEALDMKAREALARARIPGEGASRLRAAVLAEEPVEIALRVLALALAEGRPSGEPLRLERLEACIEALRTAARAGRPLRRTLTGTLLSLDRAGQVTLAPEPPRRRGRSAHGLVIETPEIAPAAEPATGPDR